MWHIWYIYFFLDTVRWYWQQFQWRLEKSDKFLIRKISCFSWQFIVVITYINLFILLNYPILVCSFYQLFTYFINFVLILKITRRPTCWSKWCTNWKQYNDVECRNIRVSCTLAYNSFYNALVSVFELQYNSLVRTYMYLPIKLLARL